MKDYNKLSDLNDLQLQNPHTFFTNEPKDQTDDSLFQLNSPSKDSNLNQKLKLATIHELPPLFRLSKSTTEINQRFTDQFDDHFKVKSQDDSPNSNLREIGYNLRKECSGLNHCQTLEKSFFFNNDQSSSGSNNLSSNQDDPFLIKTPINFRSKPKKQAKELAVDLRSVSFQYGHGKKASKVLNDVTLQVPLGGIYGLLGPSGCGKTSLLKIVIGLKKADQGMVRVFGSAPGKKHSMIPGPGLGYMPQDISLFQDLSVAETLVFYSKIYRMKSHLVPERIEFLLKLLDLSEKGNRLIKQLSGGQKRRVSLAAALVHSPPLVILDEPTVGVDPLLRQSIWEHLVRLAHETSLTVIITTHYIEEARQANTVGLMRFGRILVQSNPEKLMLKYKRNNLEDVFLRLCLMDEKEFKVDEESDQDDNSYKSQIKFDLDTVHYSNESTKQSVSESSCNNDGKMKQQIDSKIDENDKIPTVVVSDYSLPISPHMVREKENENFNRGSIYAKNKNIEKPASNENKKIRNPLSPLGNKEVSNDKLNYPDLNNKFNNENDLNQHLQVKNKRDRCDTDSSIGSSIIEYDSAPSKESSPTPVKLATFKKDFKYGFEPSSTFKNKFKASIIKIGALIYKNFTLLTRNIPLLLFQFFLPSLEIILFGICIGADPFNIKVAIFNQDTSGIFPELYLKSIDNYTVEQIHYPTLPMAINAVRNGEAWGAIAFKENFSIALNDRHLHGLEADNHTIDRSSIYIFLDMTNQLIGYKLQRTFYESFQKFSKQLLLSLDQNPSAVDLPVKIGKPIYGDKEPTFTEFMAPGVVLTIAFLATVALTALAFVMERKDGIMERILVSGVTPFEFLMSHVVTQLCVIVVQVALLLIFTFLVFDIPSRGPFIWVILLTMLQAICGMEYGLLISSLCENETAATMMALGSFYPNLLLSGTVWPTQAMPTFMRYFSYILPQTLPIEAMRYILSRGWDPTYPEVALGFGVTILWTIGFIIATMIAFRKI